MPIHYLLAAIAFLALENGTYQCTSLGCALSFSSVGECLASVRADGKMSTTQIFPKLHVHDQHLLCGQFLKCVLAADTISSKLVDRLSYKQPDNPNAEIIRDASWHPYEQRLVTAGFDGALVEWGYSSQPMSVHLNALPDTGYDNLEDHW